MWSLSEGSDELTEVVNDYLGQSDHSHTARQNIEAGCVPVTAVWTGVAEQLGLTGLTVTEDCGGAGGSLRDAAATLFTWGHSLAAAPLLSNLLISSAFHALSPESTRQALAETLLDGTVVAVSVLPASTVTASRMSTEGLVLQGVARSVLDAGIATRAVLLVPGGDDGEPAGTTAVLIDLDQEGVMVNDGPAWSGVRTYGDLTLDGAEASVIGVVTPAAEARMLAVARVLLAAERLGGSFACLDMAVDHAKTRKQFDRPIGSFQGVKHPLADLYVQLHMAQAPLIKALEQMEEDAPTAEVSALLAAVHCERAFRSAAEVNIEVHGGMGYTWEHDSHLYFRRSRWDTELAGGGFDDLHHLIPALERVN